MTNIESSSIGGGRLAQVRALLAKAEATEFPAEAEAYTAKAAELITRWGLDEAIAQAAQRVTLVAGDRVLHMEGFYQREKASLLHGVARGMGLRAVTITGTGPQNGGVAVHLFGMDGDLNRCELLFTSLLVQAGQQVAAARPANYWENVAAYRRTWFAGFRDAIQARLTTATRQATRQAGPGTDLVLANRSGLVEQRVAEAYPRLRTARRSLTGSGREHGYRAGQRANLGGTTVTGQAGRRPIAN